MLFYTIILSLFTSLSFSNLTPQSGDLTLKVQNIQDVEGNLKIGLYNDPEDFPEEGLEFRDPVVEVKGKTTSYTFENIPYQSYGIAIHHDVNADNEMQKNWMGIPKEPYGFSTNFEPSMSEPDFSDVEFSFNGSKTISVDLIQP